MTIQQKAQEILDNMELKKQGEGDNERLFYVLKTENEEHRDIIREAHMNTMPNDRIYDWIVAALEMIAESEDADSARDRFMEIEPDAYTSDLTAWLNENNHNVYYLTEALEEHDIDDGFQALAIAQQRARHEVAGIVLDQIEKKIESL